MRDTKKIIILVFILFFKAYTEAFSKCKIEIFNDKKFYMGKITVKKEGDEEIYNFKAYKFLDRLYFSLESLFYGKIYEIKITKNNVIYKDINTDIIYQIKPNAYYEEIPFTNIRYKELICLFEPKDTKKQGNTFIITDKYAKENYIEIVGKNPTYILFLNKHYIIKRKIIIYSLHNLINITFKDLFHYSSSTIKGQGFKDIEIDYIKKKFQLFF